MKFQLSHLHFCKGKISQVKQHNELSAQTAVSQQSRVKTAAILGARLTLTHLSYIVASTFAIHAVNPQ